MGWPWPPRRNLAVTESTGTPTLKVAGGVYHFEWAEGITAELERFSEHRDELTAEVTIRSTRVPRPGLIHSARLNLMSTQTRQRLESSCQKREPDLDWQAILEQLCIMAVDRYRSGDPAIDMRSYEPAQLGHWLLEPFVEHGGATILFADGGSGKSMTALAIALSIATGQNVIGNLRGEPRPVLYLDWETDPDTFHARLSALSWGSELLTTPHVYYRRQVASLAESAPVIQREIAKLGVGFVVVDSLGAARGGEPESAEVTIRTFNAARSLGVPWLAVDHVTKQAGNDATRPFGSTYSHNLARLTWSMEKAQDEGDSTIVVAMVNRKRNNGKLLNRLGYRMKFQNDDKDGLSAVTFESTDLMQTALADRQPLRSRIANELKRGPLTIQEIADGLGAPDDQIRSRLRDMEKALLIVRLPDKRVALAAREH